MSTFKNVSITKAANVYFDGRVTSRSLTLENGDKVSLGIMAPGDYEFGTAEKEIMEITAGELQVLLPGSSEWAKLGVPKIRHGQYRHTYWFVLQTK